MYESTSLGVQRRLSGHKLSCDNTSLFSGGTAVLKHVEKNWLSTVAFS